MPPRALNVGLLGAAALATFLGWRAFWFLTDDALIAFRYASQSLEGFGYVWNRPPFEPVEGYTSAAIRNDRHAGAVIVDDHGRPEK